ncbi:hypothetical protein AB0H43_36110 [Hamadaea sp. NPDC050747]|uniref:hypothetical protein n=1 Tax=Hamadaea sp. NPDC050747 TaxID=3155789 RepID=UPI003410E75A
MRHTPSALRFTLLFAGVLAAATACSGTGTPSSGGSASATAGAGVSPSATVSAAPTDLAGNTRAVCEQIRSVAADGAAQFTRKLADAVAAAQNGGAAADAAVQDIKALLGQWAAGLRGQASLALDQKLKSALTAEADAFDRAAAQITKPADLQTAGSLLTSPDVTQAGQTIQQTCTVYWTR